MRELDPDIIVPMVKSISTRVARRYPRQVEAADVEGHLYLFVYSNRKSLFRAQDESETEEDFKLKVGSTLEKEAHKFATSELTDASSNDPEFSYRYPTWRIKSLLPDAFDHSSWQMDGIDYDPQPRSRAQANTTGTRVAELIDMRRALEMLSEETRALLYFQYAAQWSYEGIADHFGITEEATKKRAQRALKALQKKLGKPDPEPEGGRRTVRSNAAWRAARDNEYDG